MASSNTNLSREFKAAISKREAKGKRKKKRAGRKDENGEAMGPNRPKKGYSPYASLKRYSV